MIDYETFVAFQLRSIMRKRQVYLSVAYCILAQELEQDHAKRLAYLLRFNGKN